MIQDKTQKEIEQIVLKWGQINSDDFKSYCTRKHLVDCLNTLIQDKNHQTPYLLSIADNPQTEHLQIEWGTYDSPFGEAFIANSNRGLVSLHFLNPDDTEQNSLNVLTQHWPCATIDHNPATVKRLGQQLFSTRKTSHSIFVYVAANPFQVRVWQTLSTLAAGHLISYGQLAALCGQPGAARAVGNALACNPIGWVIPCHRVIHSNGQIGQYRWDTHRKMAMHIWEYSHFRNSSKFI